VVGGQWEGDGDVDGTFGACEVDARIGH
jgi:hypothetical protein